MPVATLMKSQPALAAVLRLAHALLAACVREHPSNADRASALLQVSRTMNSVTNQRQLLRHPHA